MLPVDRRGLEDKVEEGIVKDLFDLAPLPSLRNEGGFFWLRPRRRCVGCECPRGVGAEANERPPEHGEQKGSEISIRSLIGQVRIKTRFEFDRPVTRKYFPLGFSIQGSMVDNIQLKCRTRRSRLRATHRIAGSLSDGGLSNDPLLLLYLKNKNSSPCPETS